MNAADQHLLSSLDMSGEFAHAELRALGLAPSRETSSDYPEGSGALMPYAQPPGVQREDSVTALLNSIGQTLSPLATGTPGSGAPVDSSPQCFDGLRLVIQSHSVHKVENPETEDREYVVSNLRFFQVEVVLVNASNELAVDVSAGLHASLLTENGIDLVWPNPNEKMLKGETEVVLIGGRGIFKLQMGANVLTSKMGKQRFRVKAALRPTLTPTRALTLTFTLTLTLTLTRSPPAVST